MLLLASRSRAIRSFSRHFARAAGAARGFAAASTANPPTLVSPTTITNTTTALRHLSSSALSSLAVQEENEEQQQQPSSRSSNNKYHVDVVVDGETEKDTEAQWIIDSIRCNESPSIPSVIYLYDDVGSSLFQDITKTDEYYPSRTELEILQTYASEMAQFCNEQREHEEENIVLSSNNNNNSNNNNVRRNFNTRLIELGAGSGHKLYPLLNAMQDIHNNNNNNNTTTGSSSHFTYIPADYSASALDLNVNIVNAPCSDLSRKHNNNNNNNNNNMRVEPFQGTHEEALEYLSLQRGCCSAARTRTTWAYLGSSLGNYHDPVPFLQQLALHCGPRDRVLLGLDLAVHEHDKPVHVIERAYQDSKGITARFILNSLSVVNKVAGLDFDTNKFMYVSHYNHATDAIEMFAECVVACNVTANHGQELVRSLQPGERIFIERSGKFTQAKIHEMLEKAGFILQRRWSDDKGYCSILELVPDLSTTHSMHLSEFVFEKLIGVDNLSMQPLHLRNPFAFYWGHIPAFTDRIVLQLPGRELERDVYERGVDPDVDDPDNKIHHWHSPRFQDWPTHVEFKNYNAQVNQGLRDIISKNGITRQVLMSLEHAEMHHETLMYMILQSSDQLKKDLLTDDIEPHPFSPFEKPPVSSKRVIPRESYATIKSTTVNLGASKEQEAVATFLWDNELSAGQQQQIKVDSFKVALCPVTNMEFAEFVQDGGYKFREFWNETNNEISKTTVANGGASAWDWICREGIERPLFWNDSLDHHRNGGHGNGSSGSVRTLMASVPFQSAAHWPVVVSLFEAAAYCQWRGDARLMSEAEYHALFVDEQDFNRVSQKGNNNWRYQGPVPVASMDDANAKGIYDLAGNGWEWTSIPFYPFAGFQPLVDYPDYSVDFFDGRHFVLKGASPYTGKLVQRMSFRNFYQPNYPYPMTKFRVVKK